MVTVILLAGSNSLNALNSLANPFVTHN